jgi:hypothetical protein
MRSGQLKIRLRISRTSSSSSYWVQPLPSEMLAYVDGEQGANQSGRFIGNLANRSQRPPVIRSRGP